MNRRIVVAFMATLLAACGSSDPPAFGGPGPDTPGRCAHHQPLRQPFFGDLHIHTRYSLDASTQGTMLGPHDAYRFAIGEEVGIQPHDAQGNPMRFVQLARPLDFAAVTDHAEFFGELEICGNPNAFGHNSVECLLLRNAPDLAFLAINATLALPALPTLGGERRIPRLPFCGLAGERCRSQAITPWVDTQQAAEAFYDRSPACGFTSFVAYEWTGSPGSNNLHRNVLFRNEVVPEFPPSYLDYPSIERLWAVLDEHCRPEDGCESLTIPHNSNLGGGMYFEPFDEDGRPYDAAFAAERQRNEPLIELYQHKGDSECINTIGAGMQDELCGFEKIPYDNLAGSQPIFGDIASGEPKEADYVRPAMKEGLRLERDLGVNPFQYGFVGSTDTHTAAAGLTSGEDFPGHGGAGQSNRDELPSGLTDLIEYSPGGLAVVWAEENTRDALWEAMRRREVYATSGTRPVVRFFAGWDLPANMCAAGDFARQGYDRGVPMGGVLGTPPAGSAPRFAVWALRDGGASGDPAHALQRIQIIKGWLDADGQVHERVLDVAGDADNGAGVDLSTCDSFGEGFDSLCTVWEDDDFDPGERAFYYARVVENPSCRWSTRQCLAGGVDCSRPETITQGFEDCCNHDFPPTIQQRAWTSPVWYSPVTGDGT